MSGWITFLTATPFPDATEGFCAGIPINCIHVDHKVFMTIGCTGYTGSVLPTCPEVKATRAVETKLNVELFGIELSMIDSEIFDIQLDNTPREKPVNTIHRTNQHRIISFNKGAHV